MGVYKKVILLFLIVFISAGLAGCSLRGPKNIESGKDMTMFVTTDIHYLANTINDHGEAFDIYAASGDGKQLNYVDEIVDAFSRDVKKKKPDILIISGDLTNNGEKESHLILAKKLGNIEKSGTRVFVIPGNHDIQNPWARGFKGSEQYKVEAIEKDNFSKIYRKFGYGEAISKDKTTLSYLAAPSEDIWLLMLDTNQYEYNELFGTPTTNGIIRAETFEWIRKCTKLAKEYHAKIITVMHHSLMNHSTILNDGYTLDNKKESAAVFEECRLELTLTGHIHFQDIKVKDDSETTLYDIATSSLSVYPQQYGVLKYSPSRGVDYSTAQVDVEGWAKENGITDKNIVDFKAYSKDYFAGAALNKAYTTLKKLEGYTDEEKKQMAETMRLLNTNYFGGNVASVRNDILQSQGYKLWVAAKPHFLRTYVLSLIEDSYTDKKKLHIPKLD